MRRQTFTLRQTINWLLSLLLLAGVLALFFQYHHRVTGIRPRLSVQISNLPYYAFCSFYRMLAAYILSLIFAVSYGLAAARSRRNERIMIPAIDVAQSVPVVGFFPAAIYFFVAIAGGSRLGVEMAAIFLIFTSQAWNLALGVYEAVKTIPADSLEALDSFGVTGWMRLKRLYLPASVPKLVYNSILSWVAGWYFLIACEIIAVGPAHYSLPGLGSFLMESVDKGRTGELVAGLITLLVIIVLMDVLVWQPLSIWAQKFRYEFSASESAGTTRIYDLIASLGVNIRRFMRALIHPIAVLLGRLAQSMVAQRLGALLEWAAKPLRIAGLTALAALLTYGLVDGLFALVRTLSQPWPSEAKLIPAAAGASLIRLLIAYVISLAWTLPCTLAASDNPRFDRLIAPLAEIAGSMPATALFPVIVVFVIQLTGNMNLASILLILTGMQWYLLFNLMAGARQVPADLKEAARSFGLSRYATWRKVTIPALTPSLITGSITAWGGGWNALILSEYFIYRGHHYEVLGLGTLLDRATFETGNGVMILLSLLSMVLIVMGLNRLIWRPVYNFATQRFRVDY
ncbi:MAG TPA: ABC transporter permease subunit [Candidatus Binataceae bacterium]|jgi:NitT/TauT family transport system permease protein|nr:ABC transporter permease subunit [Candidatus Binataceae bacterium]